MTQHTITAMADQRLFPQSRSRSHAPDASGRCLKGVGKPPPPESPPLTRRTRPESNARDLPVWAPVAPAAPPARAFSP